MLMLKLCLLVCGVQVDMCSFTGEAEPVELSPGCSTLDAVRGEFL
jgi:hypothetical protein